VISNAILSFIGGLGHVLLGSLPSIPVPSWITGSTSAVGTVFQAAGSMSVWFPITLASTVIASVLAIWGLAFTVKAARIVLSLFTGGGGGAA
jgi:hypothetical protein